MATTKTGTVYALVDPRNNRVRYVGATTKPLQVRLNGHLKGRAARRVRAWIDDLAAVGQVPRIEPITEGVAADDLREAERAEITRRLIAGENLLNESATAPARRHIERQREINRQERERAAWEHAAVQVRAIVGGPIPPGDVDSIPLDPRALHCYQDVLRLLDALDAVPPSERNRKYDESSRLQLAREKAGTTLWRSTQPLWGRLRGMAEQHFDFILSARVSSVLKGRWASLDDASRYLTILPWGLMAVGPWAALAERAGMDAVGTEFIDWVSDDASVRDALTMLLLQPDGRSGPLSVLDDYDTWARPSTGLVAMTAAHHPGFDLPETLNQDITEFMKVMVRGNQLSSEMAALLFELDPRALDSFLGPNIAPTIDARLGLPSGTSRDVLAALLEHSGRWQLGNLDRIVARAKEAFPTVKTPSFNQWGGPTAPMFQAIVASLVEAGVFAPPAGSAPEEFVREIRSLWCPDLSWLEQSA